MAGPESIGGARFESIGNVVNSREAFESRSGIYERAQFGRVVTAMVTPFRPDGSLNLDRAQDLAIYLQDNGSEGLVLAGTTGEAPTLTHAEQIDLFAAVEDVIDIPVLAGTGSNNPAEAVALSKDVEKEGSAAGLLVASPYYSKPNQAGIEDYFSQVLRATDLPVVMYDIPGRTGRPVAIETVQRLASRFDNLVGIKDAADDPAKSRQLVEFGAAYDDFAVYSGDDGRNLELYDMGAVGAISVASHWAGREIGAMFNMLDHDDYDLAERIDRKLQPSYDFETSEETPNPIPAKVMMNVLGVDVGRGRSPMILWNEDDYADLAERAQRVYADLQAAS